MQLKLAWSLNILPRNKEKSKGILKKYEKVQWQKNCITGAILVTRGKKLITKKRAA